MYKYHIGELRLVQVQNYHNRLPKMMRTTYRSRDRARSQEIPGPQVASSDAVVRQLLFHGPVQVPEVGLADDAGGLGAVGMYGHLELDVKVVRVLGSISN